MIFNVLGQIAEGVNECQLKPSKGGDGARPVRMVKPEIQNGIFNPGNHRERVRMDRPSQPAGRRETSAAQLCGGVGRMHPEPGNHCSTNHSSKSPRTCIKGRKEFIEKEVEGKMT